MRRARKARFAAREGFTLVELLVATMMMVIGVLGLASTSAVVWRMMGGGTIQTIAATMAQSRFEVLRSTTCANIASGTATSRGVTEKWVVTSAGTKLYDVADTVRFTTNRGTTTQAYRSYVKC